MSLFQTVASTIKPPPLYTVDEHAEKTLYLSERTSAITGLINFDNTPYLRKPLQTFNDPHVNSIVFCSGTQIGKTVFLFCILNYIVDHAPAPTMILYPAMDIAKQVSKDRIQQLFRDSPSLNRHMTGVTDDFQLLQYKLDRMTIRFAWNSPNSVSSHPEKYLIKDETALVDPLILKIANDRTKTFTGRKIIEASSPRFPGDNICQGLGLVRDHEAEAQAESMITDTPHMTLPVRRWKTKKSVSVFMYYVNCPHCEFPQQFHPDRLRWDRDCAIRDLTYKATYLCINCNRHITESMKRNMVRAGEWRTDNPGQKAYGFYISSLYSLLGEACTFGEIVAGYLGAHISKKSEDMEAFVNGFLAQPYEEEEFGEEAFNIESIKESEDAVYRKNELPKAVKLLTAAFDVHKSTLYYSVWGWGGDKKYQKDGYLITWGIYDIDMDHDPGHALKLIVEARQETFYNEDRRLGIVGIAVDSGYKTEDVYGWSREFPWILPVKGKRGEIKVPDGMEKYIVTQQKVDRFPSGKVMEKSITLTTVNTGFIKRELYDNIRSGRFHFPTDTDQLFIDHMHSEKLVSRRHARTGAISQFFVKKKMYDRSASQSKILQNHYLDTVVYNRAMIEVLVGNMTLDEAARKYYPKKQKRSATYSEI